jgi:pyruvoyl-dependent arginine decarboxylase (PvlArgDC)
VNVLDLDLDRRSAVLVASGVIAAAVTSRISSAPSGSTTFTLVHVVRPGRAGRGWGRGSLARGKGRKADRSARASAAEMLGRVMVSFEVEKVVE